MHYFGWWEIGLGVEATSITLVYRTIPYHFKSTVIRPDFVDFTTATATAAAAAVFRLVKMSCGELYSVDSRRCTWRPSTVGRRWWRRCWNAAITSTSRVATRWRRFTLRRSRIASRWSCCCWLTTPARIDTPRFRRQQSRLKNCCFFSSGFHWTLIRPAASASELTTVWRYINSIIIIIIIITPHLMVRVDLEKFWKSITLRLKSARPEKSCEKATVLENPGIRPGMCARQ